MVGWYRYRDSALQGGKIQRFQVHCNVWKYSYRYVKCTARWEDSVTEMLSASRGGKIQIQKCKVDLRVGRYGEVRVYRYRNVECTARFKMQEIRLAGTTEARLLMASCQGQRTQIELHRIGKCICIVLNYTVPIVLHSALPWSNWTLLLYAHRTNHQTSPTPKE